jgi:hypothetical protein
MNLLKDNAYHVLGLDTSASQKDISKRSKEILTRLKIDDVPEYDIDLDFFEDFRNENSVKNAVTNLSTPKKQIKEYFFWLQIADSVDEEAVKFFRSGKYGEAAKVWKDHSQDDTIKSLLYKKNLAIFITILLYKSKDKDILNKSVVLWSELVNSPKFWNAFAKVYKLHDELGSDTEVIEEFKLHVANSISDIYAELASFHSDNEFVTVFSKNFGLKGEKMEKDVLDPIYKVINSVVEDLEALKVSEDGALDEGERNQIKNLISSAQQEFNKLIDLGLYETSQVKSIRDRFATALRVIVLDLHNNLNEITLSEKLLKIGISFCGTESLKNRFEQELKQLEKNLDAEKNSNIVIELPSTFSTSYITFTNTTVQFQNKVFKYSEIEKVSWYSESHSTYGIPTSQKYFFRVESSYDKIAISFAATFKGGDKHNTSFAQLIGVSQNLIEPVVIDKIVDRIFKKGESVLIGTLHLNQLGISTKKTFGGFRTIPWDQVKYVPVLQQGAAHVFYDQNGKAQTLSQVPMGSSNAVTLPELITKCIQLGKSLSRSDVVVPEEYRTGSDGGNNLVIPVVIVVVGFLIMMMLMG